MIHAHQLRFDTRQGLVSLPTCAKLIGSNERVPLFGDYDLDAVPAGTLNSDGAYTDADQPAEFVQIGRNTGITIVRENGMGFCINTKPGFAYEWSDHGTSSRGCTRIDVQSGSVVDHLPHRNIIGTMLKDLQRPTVHASTAGALATVIESGLMLAGLVDFLAAFIVQVSIEPPNTPVRVRTANSCYFMQNKDPRGDMNYCIRDAQGLAPWLESASADRVWDGLYLVDVGPADLTRGMALLSRLCDEGGPLYQWDCPLLNQFHPQRLLMFGNGLLHQDLARVDSTDLRVAVEEAWTILHRYNGCTRAQLASALTRTVHNLPLIDATFFRECRHAPDQLWRRSARTHGPAVYPGAHPVANWTALLAGDCPHAHHYIGGADMVEATHIVSAALQDRVIVPPVDGSGLGGALFAPCGESVMRLLAGVLQPPAMQGEINGEAGFTVAPQAAAIGLNWPNAADPTVGEVAAFLPLFCGFGQFKLYFHSTAALIGGAPGAALTPAPLGARLTADRKSVV